VGKGVKNSQKEELDSGGEKEKARCVAKKDNVQEVGKTFILRGKKNHLRTQRMMTEKEQTANRGTKKK